MACLKARSMSCFFYSSDFCFVYNSYWCANISFIYLSLFNSLVSFLALQTVAASWSPRSKIDRISLSNSSFLYSIKLLSFIWIAIKFGQHDKDSQRVIRLWSSKPIPEMSRWFKRSVSSKKVFMSFTNWLLKLFSA